MDDKLSVANRCPLSNPLSITRPIWCSSGCVQTTHHRRRYRYYVHKQVYRTTTQTAIRLPLPWYIAWYKHIIDTSTRSAHVATRVCAR